ncbi:nuclease-related domain-containing protein [Gracilibacillus dipsosauri]|uniref:Nuclease n=1 Tax=Gracilibacillus dipsosauri TaxID=178340 RepID=A0A317L1F5_9BACI|nr:nuclease-related domain-containing protein [Gracilibacillus dipsosauri]PWU69632.1 nuclease [Gracilibacillus dipsosauri]
MIAKPRKKPNELIAYEYLSKRKPLTEEEKKRYRSLAKGFEGEVMFDTYLDKLKGEHIILKDLFLHHSKYCQIDTILLKNGKIFLFEIKNFQGEYYWHDDKLWLVNDVEIDNPIAQRDRAHSVLRRLLQSLNINLPLLSYVIFVNPECSIFQAPLDKQLILPTQINRFIMHFPATAKITSQEKQASEKLLTNHIEHPPFNPFPTYPYEELQKGIPCDQCGEMNTHPKKQSIECRLCNYIEKGSDAIIRVCKEHQFLFPERKITSSAIYHWCGKLVSKRRIFRILEQYYDKRGEHRWIYFEK